MSDEYRIEPLTEDRLDLLVPLMEDAFGLAVNRRLFDWKYRENPAGPAIGNIAIAAATGEVAAFYGMIPETYRWGPDTRLVYQSCDTMTHSRHRRKGLFKTLALRTYADAQRDMPDFFAFGFSGPMSTPGFLRMDWKIIFEVPHRFKPRLLCRLSAGRGGGAVDRSDAVSPTLLALMQANEARRAASKVYDADYLRWRLSNPAARYEYLVDGDGAYAIYFRSAGFTFVLDFWESSPNAGRAVAAALAAIGAEVGSKGLLTMCQRGGVLDRQLRRYWFLRNDLGRGPASARTPMIVFGKPPAPEAEGPAGWDVTPVDFDSY
jgi:hypothetical protein